MKEKIGLYVDETTEPYVVLEKDEHDNIYENPELVEEN